MSSRYVLDANVFIEAKNRYYGFDLCPGFWDSLAAHNESMRVFSIDLIEKELKEKEDKICDWMESRAPESFFKKTEDQAVVQKVTVHTPDSVKRGNDLSLLHDLNERFIRRTKHK